MRKKTLPKSGNGSGNGSESRSESMSESGSESGNEITSESESMSEIGSESESGSESGNESGSESMSMSGSKNENKITGVVMIPAMSASTIGIVDAENDGIGSAAAEKTVKTDTGTEVKTEEQTRNEPMVVLVNTARPEMET